MTGALNGDSALARTLTRSTWDDLSERCQRVEQHRRLVRAGAECLGAGVDRRAGWKTGLPGGKDLCEKCIVAAIAKPYEQVIRPRTPLGACAECGSEILGFKNDHEGNVTRLCGCRAD